MEGACKAVPRRPSFISKRFFLFFLFSGDVKSPLILPFQIQGYSPPFFLGEGINEISPLSSLLNFESDYFSPLRKVKDSRFPPFF